MKTFKKILLGVGAWLLRLTWGLLDTIYGFIIFLAVLPRIKKIKYIHNTITCYLDWPNSGWGLEGGLFIFSTEEEILDPSSHMFRHEYGHCIPQTLLFGPLHPFVCCIPSAVRFWYRENYYKKHNRYPESDYDDFWVEYQATTWGTKWVEGTDNWINK